MNPRSSNREPTILSVVGARPNFMKLAPVARSIAAGQRMRHVVVHTGQHYGQEMSNSFFRDLNIPAPDHNLDVGSGTHAQQTGTIMQKFEPVLTKEAPDVVLVYGDVNSTVAGALVAAKLGIPVGHVEAGLRSRDWSMPEEINRVVTDRLAHLLFTPSRDADANLLAEGVDPERIHFVGNVMIDSIVHAMPRATGLNMRERFDLAGAQYVVATLHRPSNVDNPDVLAGLVKALATVAKNMPVLFPVHPRTRARLDASGLTQKSLGDVRVVEPVSYLEMLSLVRSASLVITDSGGLQEETSYLSVPCVTVRPNTERPVTCTHGTNVLVAPNQEAVEGAALEALKTPNQSRRPIEKWDGRVGDRIVNILSDYVHSSREDHR